MEWHNGEYTISTERGRLDLSSIRVARVLRLARERIRLRVRGPGLAGVTAVTVEATRDRHVRRLTARDVRRDEARDHPVAFLRWVQAVR